MFNLTLKKRETLLFYFLIMEANMYWLQRLANQGFESP